MSCSSRCFLPAAIAIAGIALPTAAKGQELAEAIERYETCMQRKPFFFHTTSRARLARTREQKALEILVQDYLKPQSYDDFARYTIASLLGRYFDDPDYMDELAALRTKRGSAGDTWLWMQTLSVDAHYRGTAAMKTGRESKNLLHRAAAIEALARRQDSAVLELVIDACAAFPRKAGERRLLVGALSSAILAHKDIRRDPSMQKAIRAYIGLLAKEVKLAHSAKMVIARHLSKTIGKDAHYTTPEPWIRLLETDFSPPRRSGHTVVMPRFFGIESEGDRICYVIDMSDSMCKDIDPGLLKQGPTTGPKKKRKRNKKLPPDENDIPWHLIKTRFDLAREHLKISIQRLAKDKRFCVVWFGTESGMLKSCPGMIKATRTNVKRVIKELDSIQMGPPKVDIAPDGTLRGKTNMHAGLRRAFSLRSRGFAERHEYVDLKAMAEGCDTIFLLSDGAPSWDDFHMLDKDYGEGQTLMDNEYGKKVPRQEFTTYHGPYVLLNWLREEIERMNLFRKVQIHTIGIGEADIRFLRRIAKDAMGETYLLGAKAKNAGRRSK